MQLISTNFVILWVISFALYYLVPAKRQWMVLAVASGVFYIAGTGGIPVGIVLTGVGAYGCGIYLARSLEAQKKALSGMSDKERKKTVKQGFERRRRRVQILYFVYSLGILLCTKYMVVILPLLQKLGMTTSASDTFFARVVMPLGISFYTLTAIGYVVDVGREQSAEALRTDVSAVADARGARTLRSADRVRHAFGADQALPAEPSTCSHLCM